MKKIIITLLLITSLVFVLASCGKFTCDLCQQEKDSSEKHDVDDGVYCDSCYQLAEFGNELEEGLEDLEEELGDLLG